MHTLETKNQFIKLRSFGWSFARISRQIGVSKPTLIVWSRQHCHRRDAETATHEPQLQHTFHTACDHQLAILTARLDSLYQELFSRHIQSVPTPHLESIVAHISPNPPPSNPIKADQA